VCFVSRPVGSPSRRMNGSSKSVREALHARTLDIIEWDHRAFGGLVRLRRPRVDVGIGSDGLQTFVLLAQIGRRNPAALEQALAPMINVDESRTGEVN